MDSLFSSSNVVVHSSRDEVDAAGDDGAAHVSASPSDAFAPVGKRVRQWAQFCGDLIFSQRCRANGDNCKCGWMLPLKSGVAAVAVGQWGL